VERVGWDRVGVGRYLILELQDVSRIDGVRL
jgi:hypothetical protein